MKRSIIRMALAFVAFGLGAAHAWADAKVILRDKCDIGDQWATELKMKLEGEIFHRSPDKVVTRKLSGTANHQFTERVLVADKLGYPTRVARHYVEAKAEFSINEEKTTRTIREKLKLQVAQRVDDDTVTYSPAGPLTRDELELTGEHLDVMMIGGLLPAQAVRVGDAWDVEIPFIQAMAGLDGVIKAELKCTLLAARPEVAEIAFRGNAHGISAGAEVKIAKIEGTLTFDRTADRIVALTWKQEEKRGFGPVSPESKSTSTTTLKRSFNGKAKELGDAVINNIAEKPDAALLLLLHQDVKGRYEFLHERAWHAVVNGERTAVLRLLDQGELIAQLNVTPLAKAEAGKHISAAQLAAMAKEAAGFTQGDILQTDELPSKDGMWIYRHSVVGSAAEIDLQQNHYAVAGPKGDQAVFVFTTEVEQAKNLGSRDLAIIGTVVFPGGK